MEPAFLLLIPTYALGYFLWMPGDFYHSTVTNEAHYFELVESTRGELRTAIVDDLLNAYASKRCPPLDSGETGCLERLQIVGMTIDDLGHLNFSLLLPVIDTGADDPAACTESTIQAVQVLDVTADLRSNLVAQGIDATDDRDWLGMTMVAQDAEGAAPLIFPEPVGDSSFWIAPDGVYAEFAISPSLADDVEAVLDASMGNASNIPGEFQRMLYLSAITTTTVGYGDIVPITARARLLTISESILGVVLAGLFLNSIAARRGNRPLIPDQEVERAPSERLP